MIYAPVPGGLDEWLSMGAPGMALGAIEGERALIPSTARMRVRSQ